MSHIIGDTRDLRKSLEPEFSQIKHEIEPLMTRVLKILGKRKREYIQLKENAVEWYDRFVKAIKISGKVSSIQKFRLATKEPQLIATLKLFEYLGLVESIGSTIVDMLVLLLIADGQHFHVERSYGLPRIIHAKNFSDISPPSSTLADKLCFLDSNGLRTASLLIDRNLRNDIAHLNFDVNKQGEISTNHSKRLDIDERLNRFSKMFMGFLLILEDSGFVDFLNRAIRKQG